MENIDWYNVLITFDSKSTTADARFVVTFLTNLGFRNQWQEHDFKHFEDYARVSPGAYPCYIRVDSSGLICYGSDIEHVRGWEQMQQIPYSQIANLGNVDFFD